MFAVHEKKIISTKINMLTFDKRSRQGFECEGLELSRQMPNITRSQRSQMCSPSLRHISWNASLEHWAQRRDELLGRLCTVLRLLGPDGRREVLEQKFSELERQTLEQWMLKQGKRSGSASRVKGSCLDASTRCSSRAADAEKLQRLHQTASARRMQEARGVVSQASRSTGKHSFYALACLGMIRLSSRKSQDRNTAILHRKALIEIVGRTRVLQTESLEAENMLEIHLRQAISEVLPSFGLDAQGLGLRVSVRLSAHRWVDQPLATPSFPATDEASLERALKIWRRLHDSRKALFLAEQGDSFSRSAPPGDKERCAWHALRRAFLDVEADAGLDRSVRWKRLESCEQVRAVRWQRTSLASRKKKRSIEVAARRATRLLVRLARAEEGIQKAKSKLSSNVASVASTSGFRSVPSASRSCSMRKSKDGEKDASASKRTLDCCHLTCSKDVKTNWSRRTRCKTVGLTTGLDDRTIFRQRICRDSCETEIESSVSSAVVSKSARPCISSSAIAVAGVAAGIAAPSSFSSSASCLH
eukprot:TRINITY_DN11062_c6_g1_i1.p1 TRINITY_DN11062_c6_g1~~TRINITY_DN11062_c6_g1_i1.p1  ORF type:complete len:532 (+),score=70.14 TRINITY_DN11062_c6_g1_i1:102-1697(+)